MSSDLVVIEIPFWLLLCGYISMKLASAVFLQRCFVATRRSKQTEWEELKTLVKHFAFSFLFYPEVAILWGCIWPLFAAITWRWHPKYALPGVVIEYLEQKNGMD